MAHTINCRDCIVLIISSFLPLDGEYENFDITPYSTPPDLPDVMRTPDVSGGGQMSSVAAGGKE